MQKLLNLNQCTSLRRFCISLAILLLALTCCSKSFADSNVELRKIDYLMDAISSSNLTFIRNGIEYTGKEAREHLQYKLDYVSSRIMTAEDFINYIASESLTTGKPYVIRLADGKEMDAGIWLRHKLTEMK